MLSVLVKEEFMTLWIEWVRCVRMFRPACTRNISFLWLAVALTTFAIRPDILGVTSFIRASFLHPNCYRLMLKCFHSSAVVLPRLLETWVKLALRLFAPVTEGGYVVLAADGLKVPKEGKKMPAVKCLYQESSNNSKPEYIMGHSCQVLSLLVNSVTGQVFSVPLLSRICEGLIWNRSRNRKSLLDKLVDMFLEVTRIAAVPALLVADAYYASRKVIEPLLREGCHLISKARINTVAYEPAPVKKMKRPGRPRIYGRKVRLRCLFKGWKAFQEAPSPVYGDKNVVIQYRAVELLWRPVGTLVRFVLVKHPTRGRIILLSTALDLDPLTVIKIYGLRFKIEVSFKQALHTLGTYAYHFWMKTMKPIKRFSGNQNLEGQSDVYRQAVQRKMDAYHRHIQLGCIAQGLLQHLAINFRETVWDMFKSWLRTMKKNLVPSEMVVAHAMKSSFCEFLLDTSTERELKKFILDRAVYERIPGLQMTA
jgi:hypothetical protein